MTFVLDCFDYFGLFGPCWSISVGVGLCWSLWVAWVAWSLGRLVALVVWSVFGLLGGKPRMLVSF